MPGEGAEACVEDPLALLQDLIRTLRVLEGEGDADAASARAHAELALARAQSERAAALQQAASVLRAGDERAAQTLASAELVRCAPWHPRRAVPGFLMQRLLRSVEHALESVEQALLRVSPEAAELLGLSAKAAEEPTEPAHANATHANAKQ
jgi:hypothetical protein